MSKELIEQLIKAEAEKMAKEMAANQNVEVGENESICKLGAKVIIFTVTKYYTGRICGLSDKHIKLQEAGWVASTGRLSETMKTGILNEFEAYPENYHPEINRDGIIEIGPWNYPLPRETV